jgi:hypothetical protein
MMHYLRLRNRYLILATTCCSLILLSVVAGATNAQWDLDPISGDWKTADNWTPNGVPNGPADTATFGLSRLADSGIKEAHDK